MKPLSRRDLTGQRTIDSYTGIRNRAAHTVYLEQVPDHPGTNRLFTHPSALYRHLYGTLYDAVLEQMVALEKPCVRT